MKLFNTIVVFDVYTVAESPDEAIAAAIACIRDANEPLATSQQNAFETREERGIRKAWQDERPLVGANVSDEDFATLKGKTTTQAHAMLYKKEPVKDSTK